MIIFCQTPLLRVYLRLDFIRLLFVCFLHYVMDFLVWVPVHSRCRVCDEIFVVSPYFPLNIYFQFRFYVLDISGVSFSGRLCFRSLSYVFFFFFSFSPVLLPCRIFWSLSVSARRHHQRVNRLYLCSDLPLNDFVFILWLFVCYNLFM